MWGDAPRRDCHPTAGLNRPIDCFARKEKISAWNKAPRRGIVAVNDDLAAPSISRTFPVGERPRRMSVRASADLRNIAYDVTYFIWLTTRPQSHEDGVREKAGARTLSASWAEGVRSPCDVAPTPVEASSLRAVLSLFLMRRAYAVFGTVGVAIRLGHLAWDVFKNSILFPFAPSAIGVAPIAFGLLFHKYGKVIGGSSGRIHPEASEEPPARACAGAKYEAKFLT